VPHFERAVALRPNSAVIHTDYSSVLAASGQFADALRHVRRALEINPGYQPALENLSRLERMGIR
jgi:Tfp pilus assembly protein PilF